MKVNLNIVIDVKHNTTKADLNKAIEGVPDSAKMSINHSLGERSWEPTLYSIEFDWTEER